MIDGPVAALSSSFGRLDLQEFCAVDKAITKETDFSFGANFGKAPTLAGRLKTYMINVNGQAVETLLEVADRPLSLRVAAKTLARIVGGLKRLLYL